MISPQSIARAVAALTVLVAPLTTPAPAMAQGADPANVQSQLLRGHQFNSQLQFDAAAREYGVVALGQAGDDVGTADVNLKFALAQSNIGRFEDAEYYFEKYVAARGGRLTQTAAAELQTYQAQHELNKWRYGVGSLGQAIDGALRAADQLSGDAAGAGADLIYTLESGGDGLVVTEAAAAAMRDVSGRGDDILFGRGNALTNEQRRSLLRAHAHYVAAYAFHLSKDDGAAMEQIGLVERDLGDLPPDYPHWLFAGVLSLRGLISLSDDPDASAQAFSAAISRSMSENNLSAVLVRLKLAEAYEASGDRPAAGAAYAEAFAIARAQGHGVDIDVAAPYLRYLAGQPASAERDAEQFRVLQSARSLSTARTLNEVAFQLQAEDSEDAADLRNYLRLREEKKALEAQLSQAIDTGAASGDRGAFLRDRLQKVVAAERAAYEQSRDLVDDVDKFSQRVVELGELRRVLAPGEVVLVVQVGRFSSFVGAVSQNSFDLREERLTSAQARAAVSQLKAHFVRSGDRLSLGDYPFDAAYDLYARLVAPSMQALPGQGGLLTVVPSGVLASLPFDMLVTAPYQPGPMRSTASARYHNYSGAPWLARRAATATALSLSTLYAGRTAPPAQRASLKPFAGFGDFAPLSATEASTIAARKASATPGCERWIAQNGLNTLPGTGPEVEAIRSLIGSGADAFTGAAFNDGDAVLGSLGGYRVLHFATHGMLSADPGLRRCLAEPALWASFNPSDGDSDALLSASEIARLDLNAELVVLSACDTGGASGGSVASGESLTGLTRSFFAAGVTNVIASHWKVSDRITTKLMTNFYRELLQNDAASLADKLQTAKLALIEGENGFFSHPFYWAAFSVVGDGSAQLTL